MLIQVLFYLFATILLLAALGVIVARNPVYSALGSCMCFVTSAAIWLLLEAEFLAVVLVLVYVGAVMVLFLFVVMMLDINLAEFRQGFTRFAWLGWLTALAVIVEIVGGRVGARRPRHRRRARRRSPPLRATAIRSSSGACSTRNTPIRSSSRRCCCWSRSSPPSRSPCAAAPGSSSRTSARQVAVRRADRLRIVKMDAEKRP